MKFTNLHPVSTLFEAFLNISKAEQCSPLVRMFKTEYARDYRLFKASGQKIDDKFVTNFLNGR